MRRLRSRFAVLAAGFTFLRPGQLPAQSPAAPSDTSVVRGPPPHALALADIGRSGLRALWSASGSIGDLQNRAGSYRTAVQLERARVGPLEGKLAALEAALADPALPAPQRAVMEQARESTLAELHAVPRYDAVYRTATLQLEALTPLGFVGDRPLFLRSRVRGHARGGGADELTVFSEGAFVGPVLVVSRRWIVGLGVGLGRTDVDIGAFDGESGSTSFGAHLNVGGILADGWGVAAQLGHGWSHGRTTILRPGADQLVEVTSAGWSTVTTAKVEAKGRLPLVRSPGARATLSPRLGAFITSSHSRPTTNNLGETGTGPFGERETLAALRASASVDWALGDWTPSLSLGWERELTHEMSVRVSDPTALLTSVGVGWAWRRGRRVVLDYSYLRGSAGLRSASEWTLVLLLDR